MLQIGVSAGELLDKITILKIKQERILDEMKLKNINHELDHLISVMAQIKLDPFVLQKIDELKLINEELWQVEDELRECEGRGQFDTEFIRLARSVYQKNDQRSRLKKELNLHLASGFVEEKSYRDYQIKQDPHSQTTEVRQ